MLTQPKVLLLSSDDSETESLQQILQKYAVLQCARSWTELLEFLETGVYEVCLCSWRFQAGIWKDAIEEIRHCDADLPVIVLSRLGGDREWSNVLAAGAFDLLAPPYRWHTVVPAVEQAVDSYEARTRSNQEGPVLMEKAS